LQTALSAIRELLLASKIPMEETLNISIDFVSDMAVWRDASDRRSVRVPESNAKRTPNCPPSPA